MKKCLTSIVLSEMQIKTTIRNHNTMIKIAKIKKTNDIKYFQGCGATRISYIADESVR